MTLISLKELVNDEFESNPYPFKHMDFDKRFDVVLTDMDFDLLQIDLQRILSAIDDETYSSKSTIKKLLFPSIGTIYIRKGPFTSVRYIEPNTREEYLN